MAKFPDDDYFAGTSMTFGEHLEELRGALVKALVALLIGFFGGLAIADHVVKFIQLPLERALTKYYVALDLERLEDDSPEEAAELRRMLAENAFIRKYNLTFTFQYFKREELQELVDKFQGEGEGEGEGDEPRAELLSGKQRSTSAPEATPDPAGTRHEDATSEASLLGSTTPEQAGFIRLRMWVPQRNRISALNAQEAFMIWLKAGFITGVIVSSPIMFYYIWNFVAAGLYPHEQRYVYLYLPFSILLFLAGASMAFFFVFDPVLDFLFSFNRSMEIDPDPRISEWLSFVLVLPLGFGVAFQLPLVMLFVNRIGVVPLGMFVEKWRLAVLGIFVVSMVLTPADPISMLLMAVPLTVLYFLGILLCLWMPSHRSPFAEEG